MKCMSITGKTTRGMDEYGYENFDNQQALLHQINANQEQLKLKHRFRKMLDSPFFGRGGFLLRRR